MAQTFDPKPWSQKFPENRHGTRSYRSSLRSMIQGNIERAGQLVRTTPRVEKKALNIVRSEGGYVAFILDHPRNMRKFRAVVRFIMCFEDQRTEY